MEYILNTYGNVSDQVIPTILDLWATKDRCFLKTDMALFKKGAGKRIGLSTIIACYCAGIEVGAIEGLEFAERLVKIENSKLSSVDTFFKNTQKK